MNHNTHSSDEKAAKEHAEWLMKNHLYADPQTSFGMGCAHVRAEQSFVKATKEAIEVANERMKLGLVCPTCDKYRTQIASLESRLAVAIEALEHIGASNHICNNCKYLDRTVHYEDIAREALTKIKGEGEGKE